jgi:hypothetical protein
MTNETKNTLTGSTSLTPPTGSAPLAPPPSKNYYEQYGDAAAGHNIIGELLKFSKFGEYQAGRENRLIAHGTELACYMGTLSVGYIRWEDGRPVDYSNMGLVNDGFIPPKRSELGYDDKSLWERFDDGGEPRDPWQFSNSVVMVNPHTEELFTFSTSSKGGLAAVGKLSKEYGKHMRSNPDEQPVISLEGDSYIHPDRKRGEIRIPIFRRVGWLPLADLPALEFGGVLLGSGGGQQTLPAPDAETIPF